jgi:hypothetical protein
VQKDAQRKNFAEKPARALLFCYGLGRQVLSVQPGFSSGQSECVPGLIKRGGNMGSKIFILIIGSILVAFACPLQSHELVDINGRPVSTHEHVWRQQDYGSDYRQGHSVNGNQGSITVWSPNTYQGYNSGKTVRFARPVPFTKPSHVENHRPELKKNSRVEYGKNR